MIFLATIYNRGYLYIPCFTELISPCWLSGSFPASSSKNPPSTLRLIPDLHSSFSGTLIHLWCLSRTLALGSQFYFSCQVLSFFIITGCGSHNSESSQFLQYPASGYIPDPHSKHSFVFGLQNSTVLTSSYNLQYFFSFLTPTHQS